MTLYKELVEQWFTDVSHLRLSCVAMSGYCIVVMWLRIILQLCLCEKQKAFSIHFHSRLKGNNNNNNNNSIKFFSMQNKTEPPECELLTVIINNYIVRMISISRQL